MDSETAERILDQALALAGETSWEALRLSQVAERAQLPLSLVASHYRSKDDLAEALFDRADRQMLDHSQSTEVQALEPPQRLAALMLHWFACLRPHRKAVRAILGYKLEPGHFHLQAHGITRISRTVQWLREAAVREHQGLARSLDELSLTAIYLRVFCHFLRHEDDQSERLLNHWLVRQARWVPAPGSTQPENMPPA